MTTFVVVGGDAAGMSAASKAKRDDPDLEVVVFEQGEWVSYGACGLPYYVKGEIQTLEELVSVTPEQFRRERDIDLRTGHEVVDIDTDDRTVTATHDGGEVVQSYDHLLVATGSESVLPPIDGIDLDGVYTLGSMTDGKELREFVARSRESSPAEQPDRGPACHFLETCEGTVGIVGGGYIGVEMAEALAENGFEVHLFQRGDRVLKGFSEATSEAVADHLREQDVALYLGAEVEAFDGDGAIEAVRPTDERVSVEMALLGTGVRPRTDLAEAAGIELGPTGAIATDEYRVTNVANVYAAGDCAEARHAVTGDPAHVPLALTANRHGRAIGRTVAGTPTTGGDVAGTAALKAFEVEAARTGVLDDETARQAGFDPITETIDAKSRAGYYPEGGTVTVTLTADRDSGRVLGGSLVSEYGEGAVHRSHALVGAVTECVAVDELSNYDLAYAPPFNTTWDPVLTAALGALGVPLAGCTDDSAPPAGGSDAANSTEATPGETSATATGDPSTEASPTDSGDDPAPTDERDLREANVVGTEADDSEGEDEVQFSVTLIHDDEGEKGYANWWQVETLDGDRLGRRSLAHPHGTREFTRSETVSVPPGVDCVVVRAHDQTHGYGGQSMLFDPGSGATRVVRQGSDPAAFDPEDCPE